MTRFALLPIARQFAALVAGLILLVSVAEAAAPAKKKSARRKRPAATVPKIPAEGMLASYVDRVPLHYRTVGKGEPTLVFIHGWSCNAGFWDAQVEAFSKTRRVVVLDLAGHGTSGKGRLAWNIKSFAGDVKTVIEELRLQKVVLVGHSMGGAVMIETARLLPNQVVGMVAVDTLHDLGARMPDVDREAFLARFDADFKGATEGLVRQIAGPGADAAIVQRVVDTMGAQDPAIGVAALRELLMYDGAAASKTVRAPVVAINGEVHPTNVEGNRALLRGGFELVTMPGVGHFPQLERPDEFNAHLATILKRWR